MASPGQGEYGEVMDMTADARQLTPGPAPVRRVPWSPRAWGQALSVAGGLPVQLIPWLLLALLARAETRSYDGWHLRTWLAVLLACAAIAFVLVPVLTRVQCHRLRSAGVDIPRRARRPDWLTPGGIAAALRAQSTWRQVAYHLLAGPAIACAGIVAVGTWLASLLCATVYLYGGLLHDDLIGRATYSPGPVHRAGILLTAAGIAGLLVAPWLTAGVARLDARAGRALLGPSRAEELANRVEQLTQTRAGVVDAADAERRRLERDLHDGTQQRLVSLAMNLGMARAHGGSAAQAHQVIAEAHEEAKAALAELRDLIRGLHPAVLEDRGLDAALSGIAARMPIPVRLDVDLPRRPAPVIEAVAYFVVSEGLSNIVKHAQANEAVVSVQRSRDRLHVIVTDDGVGGADPARGTGLAGLARRAASVDGTFEIDSPPGGPTLLTVDLPCNR
jgi:signal transduction histidine kinase